MPRAKAKAKAPADIVASSDEILCPFMGTPITVYKVGPPTRPAWIGSVPNTYVTTGFPSREALVAFLTTRASWGPGPLKAPNRKCPFTGEDIEIRKVDGGRYCTASVSTPKGGWQSSLFDYGTDAIWFISHRNGEPPSFSRRPTITVRERQPDESGSAAIAAEAEGSVDLEQAATEAINRHLNDTGPGG